MGFFEHGGVHLGYDDTGGDVATIVFLHGLSMSRDTWARFLPDLEGRFRVVRLDQRGHGESSHAGSYVLDSYLDDTIAFLEAVVAGPSIVVGHSLGGVIAHGVTQLRPDLVRAALLEDPPLYVADRMSEGASREEASSVAAMFPLMQNLCREMQARNAPLAEYEAMIAAVPSLNGAGTMADAIGPNGARAMSSAFAQLDPEIFTPAIEGSAIAGKPDRSAPLERPVTVLRADPALGPAFGPDDEVRFLETNPHGRVVLFEGASHALHDEQPVRFLDELLAVARGADQVSSS
jgi:pimeloyl-ACP methyl ester carboxylesterase